MRSLCAPREVPVAYEPLVYWLVNVDELVATLGLGSNLQGALLWQMSKLVL